MPYINLNTIYVPQNGDANLSGLSVNGSTSLNGDVEINGLIDVIGDINSTGTIDAHTLSVDGEPLSGSLLHTITVEEGKSGNWKWTKFSNGYAICTYCDERASMTFTQSSATSGAVYYSQALVLPFAMKNTSAYGSFNANRYSFANVLPNKTLSTSCEVAWTVLLTTTTSYSNRFITLTVSGWWK